MDQKKKTKQPRKFFVKEEDGVFIATVQYFESIESRTEALSIALATYGEIQRQMLDDYIVGSPLFIGNMKVITGLERTLSEIDNRFPFALLEMHSSYRKMFGRRLAKC